METEKVSFDHLNIEKSKEMKKKITFCQNDLLNIEFYIQKYREYCNCVFTTFRIFSKKSQNNYLELQLKRYL